MEIILRAVDKASDVVEGIGQTTDKAAGWIDQNWTKIAAGAAAAGGAMEMAARKQAPLTEQTQRLSNALDMAEDEVRDLALGMSDVTFPIDEVLGLMEKGRQQGIESAEALEEYALFWDQVGDATGLSAERLAESSSALRAVGIAAGEEAQALDAFGYITQETSGSVDDFMHFIDRTGPELREMGADVDDAAAVLGALEHELGMSGRTARTEFRQAINEANGDMGKALETLGLSEEQFKEYRGAVADSSDVIEKNAEAHEESYTTMERLQARAEDLMYQYGDLIGVVGDFAPLMMGLGPILKGVTTAKKALGAVSMKAMVPAIVGATKAAWGFTAALLANPITWIVLLIVGLIAAIVALWKNWDTVSENLVKAWDWIRERATAIWEGIKNFFKQVWQVISGIFEAALQFIIDLFTKYHPLGLIISNWEEILDFFRDIWSRIIGTTDTSLDDIVNFFAELPGRIWEWLVNLVARIFNWDNDMRQAAIDAGHNFIENYINFIRQLPGRVWTWLVNVINRFINWRNTVVSRAAEAGRSLLRGFMDVVRNLPGQLWDTLQRAVRNLMNIGGALWNAARNAGQRIWNGISSALGISSPSHVERAIDAMADRAAELPGEMQRHFGQIEGLQPELDANINTATSGLREGGVTRSELTIKHDLENVPDHIDENKLANMLAQTLKRPEMRRELDKAGHKTKQRFKAQGREI